MKYLALLLALCMFQIGFGQWNTAYYATWNQTTLNGSSWNGEHLGQPPDQVDWTGITHVVHFGNGNIGTTSPYLWRTGSGGAIDTTEIVFGPDGGTTDYQSLLISTAHSHGVKVCLSLQAVDPTGLHTALASQTTANTFCDYAISYCKAHGYDGVEIDWEGETPDPTLATRLITTLRTYLDKYYLPTRGLILLSPGLNDGSSYTPSVCDAAVDQYNIQTYAMIWSPNNTNHTWHVCPVYPGTAPSGEDDQGLDGLTDGSAGDVQGWITAGHDPAKVGLLLNTFGYFFIGADGLFQSWSQCIGHNGSQTVTQNSMLTGLLSVGGTMTWDATRQGSYISGTATAAYGSAEYGGVAKGQKFFAPLATPQWINAVVQYWKTKKFVGPAAPAGKILGGLSLYSLSEDFDPTKPAGQGRNVIHDALRDALKGALSITLSSFTVVHKPNGSSVLTWVTLSETSNYGFTIERQNGANWDSIAFVSPKGPSTYTYTDNTNGVYRLKQADLDGTITYYTPTAVTGIEPVAEPATYSLDQNYPNPFNPTTTIGYSLKKTEYAKVMIYNMLGQIVYESPYQLEEAGHHTVWIDGSRFASGTYIYSLQTETVRLTKTMTLLK